jgi:deoxyribodipyrimidine photolyase
MPATKIEPSLSSKQKDLNLFKKELEQLKQELEEAKKKLQEKEFDKNQKTKKSSKDKEVKKVIIKRTENKEGIN